MRSSATRSRDEARALAQVVLARARAGEDFAQLARTYNDGNDISHFDDETMAIVFSDYASLRPGELSEVKQTPLGFTVVRRTK